MPQVSTNKLGQTGASGNNNGVNEVAPLLLRLANQLEEEICRALMEDNVALAERLVAPQCELKKLAQGLG